MSTVDAYIDELSRRLSAKLPRDLAEARLREARAHLEEAVRIEGEAAALRRFGNPAANTRAIVRQARGYGSRGAESLSRAPGIVLAVSVVLACLAFDHGNLRFAIQLQTSLTFAAALLFAARCLQTRRWLVLPTLAWGGAAFALCMLSSAAFPTRLPRPLQGVAIENASRDVAASEANARDVALWRAGRRPEHVSLGEWRPSAKWYVVGVPLGISVPSEPHYDAQRFENRLADTEENWSRYGEAWARTVVERRKDATSRLAAAQAGLLKPPVSLVTLLTRWLVCVAQLVIVLVAYNALALLLGRLADASPSQGRTSVR